MPVVTHMVKPKFSKEARKAKTGGTVLVGLWVGKDGVPSHLNILKSAGNGLDENAIEAVAGYRFRPATENGIPVAVRLNVEVNFKVY